MTPLRTDLAIIGGGPAAMACARAYRTAGACGGVVLIGEEERLPYRRPPLTKELLQGRADEADLPLEGPSWPAEQGVRFVGGRAVSVDPDTRRIALADGREVSYRMCVLATGAVPRRLDVRGADDPGVIVLRTLDHTRELLRRLAQARDVVVVGSGFIGCEIAASLRMRGHDVALVSDEMHPQLARLGPEVAQRLRAWLTDAGVRLLLGEGVEEIRRDGDTLTVRTATATAAARIVVMAAGAHPRTELAVAAGLALDDGAVPVDQHMRTAIPRLFAVGDVALADHAVAGRPLRVEHWGDALAQGDVAGRVVAGADARWETPPGFWSTIGERTLKHAAWGDGYDTVQVTDHDAGAFTAEYWQGGRFAGVLTHDRDEDYDAGRARLAGLARVRVSAP